ncbi:MAG: diguanylate cyclase domain-containing protein [Allosphingosinicella sp.]
MAMGNADERADQSGGTYVILVRSLYLTFWTHVFMSFALLAVAVLALARTPDLLLMTLTCLAMATRLVQTTTVFRDRGRALSEDLGPAEARILELRFARVYLCFAIVFGAFSARAIQISPAEVDLLLISLEFGYGAGLIAGLALRPRISIPALLLAGIPPTIALALEKDLAYFAVATLSALFLAAGTSSILRLYRTSAHDISMRRTLGKLARRDDLTGLPNRLDLRESFGRLTARSGKDEVHVIHCLDLDRFKQVNDLHGHQAGDALLVAVSKRLTALLREDDIAARLGGDEFVIIQAGASHPWEAELLARRIQRSISEPFTILGQDVVIGTSIGCAHFPEHGSDLEDLLRHADEALLAVKREGGGSAFERGYGDPPETGCRPDDRSRARMPRPAIPCPAPAEPSRRGCRS